MRTDLWLGLVNGVLIKLNFEPNGFRRDPKHNQRWLISWNTAMLCYINNIVRAAGRIIHKDIIVWGSCIRIMCESGTGTGL